MKQFLTILGFELKSYFKNKIFVGVTAFLVVLLGGVMFFPSLMELMGEDTEENSADHAVMLVEASAVSETAAEMLEQYFSSVFSGYQIEMIDGSEDEIREQVISGEADCAFVLNSLTDYTYYVDDLSMYDTNTDVADEILKQVYQAEVFMESGMDQAETEALMSVSVTSQVNTLGKDQNNTFFYTYIMTIALYMVILLYGQMVSTAVATEKSSRAMELLITSAKPTSMMFGKVIAASLAGLFQMTVVFGSAILFYFANRAYWKDNAIVTSIFDMPVQLLLYMLIFFVLGFLIYAFLYGAIGSTASKVEDINTSTLPLTILSLLAFMIAIFGVSGGETDSLLIKICSFIPFTSPMVMFARIAMSSVPVYEIVIAIAILIFFVWGIGRLSAKIYRVGVLLYGTPPKPGAIIRAVKNG
ncbi:MAG: ABC transporter permease [Lachnospiraceae bacterium]|nr:ABC transporter permease [Lachnospiraceae bacterium]